MKLSTSKTFLGILVVGLVIAFGASSGAMGQGRSRRNSHWDRKCEKFVNCHDARDGRWDGRGRYRRTQFNNTYRRYRRDRDFDNNRWRSRYHNREFSNNRHWRRNR